MVTFFMPYINIEIKARCANAAKVRDYLTANHARLIGTDEQTDTYFHVAKGRLKLREGNIENSLIFYQRNNTAGPKQSDFKLSNVSDPVSLKSILTTSLGIKVTVKKKRENWYIENVKFHIDEVPGLGSFIEIEAGNILADKTKDELQQQCVFYMEQFGIREKDLVSVSYSDMILEKEKVI